MTAVSGALPPRSLRPLSTLAAKALRRPRSVAKAALVSHSPTVNGTSSVVGRPPRRVTVNVNVPGGPPATMSANQARTASRMPALGTRMPRSSVGKPLPVSRKSSTCANSGTKVTVPGAVPTLAAWVAGPFWSSAAVAAPLAALAWSVPGVV